MASRLVVIPAFDEGEHSSHRQSSRAEGTPLWQTDTQGAVLSTPALAGELLIIGNRAYDVLALSAATGKVTWKRYLWFSWVESSATVADGVAYLGSSDAAAMFSADCRAAHCGRA